MSDPGERTIRDERLEEVLAAYLDAGEREPQRATEWIARYPEFALELERFISNSERLQAALVERPPPTPDAPVPFGTDFELLAELGTGGMGVVYRARQKSLDRIVALKMIRAGHLATADERRRFNTEARAAARLRHPNIVAVHGTGEHDGYLYICMELVEGQGLDRTTARSAIKPADAARYVAAAAGAIQFAHERGVLHRDLKPSNILLDESGQPKLADFGLARLIGHDDGATAVGSVFGTPAYMSPEQAAGRQTAIGPATDVYSLGAVLYELLTGRPPFRGDTPAETVWNVLHTDAVPPRLVNPAVPLELEAICLHALEKEPGRRYATARDLAEDLRRYLDGEPVRSHAVSYPERLWRLYRPRPSIGGGPRRSSPAAGLLAGLVAAALIGAGPRLGWWPYFQASSPNMNTAAAIVVLMVVWWVTEAIPLAATALVPLVAFPLTGLVEASVVSSYYTADVVILFLGGILIALAIEDSGLSQRFAWHLVRRIGRHPRRLVLALMAATAALSMWLSNTATVLIMLPMAFSVLLEVQSGDDDRDRALTKAVMIGIAYAASIGGTATPVGTPANQKFMEIAQKIGFPVDFVHWMAVGVPFAVAMVVVAWFILVRHAFPLGALRKAPNDARAERRARAIDVVTPAERRMLVIGLVTILLWVFREPYEHWGWLPLLAGRHIVSSSASISDGTVAMLMALGCFAIPSGRRDGTRLLEWRTTQRVPWAVVLLFGGGIALAAGVTTSGLDKLLGGLIEAARTALPQMPLVDALVGASTATLATQLTPSNLSTVEMVLPAMAGIAASVAMLASATIAASCDFLFPWSTPPNAIVYGAGGLTVRDFFRAGIWLTAIGLVLNVVLVSLLVWLFH